MMKFLIDIGYVFLASLLLAMIFLSFDYSFGQAFFLGSLFMPGAFALKYFIPQLSFSDRKKGVADAFFLAMAVTVLTFFLVLTTHTYVFRPSKFHEVLLNPVFTVLILGILVSGDVSLQRLYAKFSSKIPDTVSFVSDRHKVTVNTADIAYIESNDKEVYIHMSDGTLYRNKTPISQWESVLGERFIRSHRAFLVNLDCISGLDSDCLSVGMETIPVSRKYRESVSRLATLKKRC